MNEEEKQLFDFYECMYRNELLDLEDLKKAVRGNCLSKENFKIITKQEYTE